MAPHSSTLAWKIPWTEEPGRLQSMGSRRVGHNWATSLSLFTFMHWRRKWQPTPVFLPGESQGRGAWWAAVHGVAQSRTRLKRLSSSSISCSVMSDSLRSHGLWPTRLLCSWDSPGKKTRVDCHSLLQCICIYLCNIVSYARESYRAQINFKKTMINQWKKIKC